MLDRQIQEMALRLKIEPAQLKRLEADKLIYMLCENENQVKEYTGISEAGWHDPRSHVLITNFLPHTELVAEFLICYRLGERPLRALPFVEKGLPVWLGGRPGVRLACYAQLANFSLHSELVKLEDILGSRDFYEKAGSPDFSHTLAAYLIAFLERQLGMDGILRLYSAFSGTKESVDSADAASVKGKLAAATGQPWDSLAAGFMTFLSDEIHPDIHLANDRPSGEPVFQSGTAGYQVAIYDDSAFYFFEAQASGSKAPSSTALLFSPRPERSQPVYISNLFAKHFPNCNYHEQYYGIIFNTQEIGIYNYLSDEILAKYIVALDEPAPDLTPGRIAFRFPKSLIPAGFDQLKIEIFDLP